MSARRVMRRAALALALVLGLGCAETTRAAALDFGSKAAVIVARGVVRAVGLCDDAPAPARGPEADGGAAQDAAEGG
ncbi:MAG: hypothetical protein U0324_46390 [Polyangiales bacterium]